jgi:hypothetical protein
MGLDAGRVVTRYWQSFPRLQNMSVQDHSQLGFIKLYQSVWGSLSPAVTVPNDGLLLCLILHRVLG